MGWFISSLGTIIQNGYIDIEDLIMSCIFQANVDMGSALESMKNNMDKLLEPFKDANEKMKDNNNRKEIYKQIVL